MGTETWGDVRGLSTHPKVSSDEALAAGYDYAGGASSADEMLREPTLEIIPVAPQEHQRGEAFAGPIGSGYDHRLTWTYVFRRPPDTATWEVIVDAHSGQVLAFQDINHYAEEQVTGGVYPVTSTEICPTNGTCGTMQSGWPMPFADTGLSSPNNFTNSAGIFDWTGGTVTTTLSGQYVNISDSCGSIVNSSTTGSLDLGGSNGDHDCTTGGGSSGNTAASRTAFYELNKLKEQARGWLPSNSWLDNQLTANVNLNNTCNAFWNGSSVNFYRSGGGCRNTGELAGVFDHEWGHGLDDFDAGGSLSNSSEAYADIAAIYRLQTSCVGHGFFETSNQGCGMTADGTGYNADEAQTGSSHCALDCSGVRDADWDKHADHTPDTPLGFVCNSCLSGSGPCGRQVHCSAAPTRQAAWDLVARDLQSAPFNYDSETAFLVGNKIFYQGSGNVGSWHSCSCGSSSSGCGSTNGYMQWLVADDDNGNLNDGTPHMTAIHAAFDRHGIACSSPTPTNSGCSGGPSGATTLSATAGDYQASLSWGSVSGANSYWVFRTEGHAGCDFGKTLIAETTGTSYVDTEVANGREYHYNVVAAGSSDACYGTASNCETVTPAASTSPDFSISCSPSSLTVTQGSNTTSTCTVTSLNGYSGSVSLSCSGLPSGSSCSFSPDPVTPTANSTLTVTASSSAATGSFSFDVDGTDGTLSHSFPMSLQVNTAGSGGAQNAVFDSGLQAPACNTVGTSCDSTTLLEGRDNISGGAEANQPNTINDSCSDGTSGSYLSDESIEQLVVSTVGGSDFAPGVTVQIDATVHVWPGGPTSDHLDLYYAADANSPSWTYITTINPTSGGLQTYSTTYTLPAGPLQAVRANFRYNGSTSSCSTGSYDDHDDLVFAVDSPTPTVVFSDDFESDLGWTTDPSGTDTATTGHWARANPEQVNYNGPKQLGTTFSGVNDLVTGPLFGTSAGTHDIDSGETSIQSPAISLPSSGTLTLSFRYYLAHASNSSSADYLRVKVVGSTTSTVFEELGAGNDDDAAWAAGSADISSFAGETVRILIEAADASTASLVEAGVDDVEITQQ
ncbi:MAG: endopeptidase [Acidobacteriota bacterium]